MIHRILLGTTLLLVPAAAFAQSLDTDGDGAVTLEEVQTTMPEMSPEAFFELDLDGDGALDETEIAAAEEAGTLPAMSDAG